MTVEVETIPQELKDRDQWVVWRLETREDKLTKVPYNARTGEYAESDNPDTWSTFEECLAVAHQYSGMGYVFSEDDPFVGIDLDDCIVDGCVLPWAERILLELNSYSEVSPSGTGIKVWVIGDVETSAKPRKSKIPETIIPHDEPGSIEIYPSKRFFTVTGWQVEGLPNEIRYANGSLTSLYEALRPPPLRLTTRTAPTRPAGRKYLERWAQQKIDYAVEQVRSAVDGERHNTRYAMARLLGGLVPLGLASEDEIASVLFNAQTPKKGAQRSEYKTIIDGIRDGASTPLELPEEPEQPVYNKQGVACCPRHTQPLDAAHNGNGWVCRTRDSSSPTGWCRFWWDGDGMEVGLKTNDQWYTTDDIPSHPQYTRSWLEEDELSRIQLPRFLVDGVIVMGETTIIYGPSDAGKTFVVIDMVMRVAQYYGVMYVAGEDMSGVRLRKTAWQQYYRRAPNGNFRMWNAPFSLFNNEDVDNFILQNKAVDTRLIVFDTLSQCSLGADENSNTDMAVVMNNANRIAHEVGAAVVIIHHTTKGESSWRGAAAIKGNTYGFFLVEKPDDVIKLECIRIKNSAPTQDKYYKLVEVQVDGMYDPNGAPIVSCVIRPSRAVVRSETLTKQQLKMLETIGMIAKAEGKAISSTIMSSMDVRGNTYYRPLNILLERGFVEPITTKQGNMSGYRLSDSGRDYLIRNSQSAQRISENDIDADLFVVNSIDGIANVDGDVFDLAPLPQVEEPSRYRNLDGF